MTDTLAPPHSVELERELLGSMMLFPHAVEAVCEMTGPEDFYSPAHGDAFAAIVAAYGKGTLVAGDARAVASELNGGPVTNRDLYEMVSAGTAAWRTAAKQVADLRYRRDLLHVAAIARQAADSVDPVAATLDVRSCLEAVGEAQSVGPSRLELSADIAESDEADAPWVIPGLLREADRAVIVGFEGHGKSVLLAQVSWAASQGLHPFTRRPIDPIGVLYVDLENPRHRVRAGYRPLKSLCEAHSPCFDRSRHWTWRAPGGIDVRGRKDTAEFERYLRQVQPDLVCLGPLRKCYRRRSNENDEASALDVQAHLDKLRERFGFAMLIEHHAPHPESGSRRKARPFGSSTWLGWSEFGYGMTPNPDKPGVYDLDAWRNDRVEAGWPDELHRGSPGSWPWDGLWRNGMREDW